MINKFSEMINESNSPKIKLGIDVHGVIDAMPEFFAFMTDAFVKNGGEVHIITGGSWTEEMKSEIESYGIKYTHVFSVYDFLVKSDSVTTGEIEFPDGTIQSKFRDEDWDVVKANYCRDNGITLHLDDTMSYNEFFSTPFARLWSHSGQKKKPHKDVRHMS
jgi:hypothetical protein